MRQSAGCSATQGPGKVFRAKAGLLCNNLLKNEPSFFYAILSHLNGLFEKLIQ